MRAQVRRPAAAFVKKCLEPTVQHRRGAPPARAPGGAHSRHLRRILGFAQRAAPHPCPYDPAMLAQVNELLPARRGAVSDGLPGAAGTAAPQGRAAHLLCQPPEPRRHGADLGCVPEELRSITRPIAAKDYWTKTPFKTVDHHRRVQRGVCRPASQPRAHASPAAEAAGNAAPALDSAAETAAPGGPDPAPPEPAARPRPKPCALRCLTATRSPRWCGRWKAGFDRDLPRRHTRPWRRAPALQVGPVQAGADVPERGAGARVDQQRAARMPKGEVVPVPILCSVTFGAPMR